MAGLGDLSGPIENIVSLISFMEISRSRPLWASGERVWWILAIDLLVALQVGSAEVKSSS